LKVDVVVNTAQGPPNNPAFEETVYNLISSALHKSTAAGNPKKKLIFISGGLVYVSNPNGLVTEESPVSGKSIPFLENRIKVEKAVIETVMRMGLLFGLH